MTDQILIVIKQKIDADNVADAAGLLEQHRGGLAAMAAGACSPPAQLLAGVRSVGMADLLIRHGLTPAMVSDWWAPGFGLNEVSSSVAEHLINCGAVVTPHAAAALGLAGRLRDVLDRQPELVHAKGGDGGRPLHFCRNVETARLLVDRGAELDARDDDHDSTPAQWRIGDAPEVTRFLLGSGARPDIFMAAALGDPELAKKLIRGNPACTTYRIGNNKGPFPGIGFKARGGTIYQWTLAFNQSPQEVAHHHGHQELFDLLLSHTPPRQRLLVACMLANRSMAGDVVALSPGLIDELDDEDLALLAKCCWETNLNREAVRLMLDLGFPIDTPEFNHGYQALHNAAWCGDAELVELLLQRGHPVDRRDPNHHSTALGFAIHSCVVARRHPEGDFPRVVRLLLEAGTPLDDRQYPSGHTGIDAAIQSSKKGRHE